MTEGRESGPKKHQRQKGHQPRNPRGSSPGGGEPRKPPDKPYQRRNHQHPGAAGPKSTRGRGRRRLTAVQRRKKGSEQRSVECVSGASRHCEFKTSRKGRRPPARQTVASRFRSLCFRLGGEGSLSLWPELPWAVPRNEREIDKSKRVPNQHVSPPGQVQCRHESNASFL